MKKTILLLFFSNFAFAKMYIKPHAGLTYSVLKIESSDATVALNQVYANPTAGLRIGMGNPYLSLFVDTQYELFDQNKVSSGHSVSASAGLSLSSRSVPVTLNVSYVGYTHGKFDSYFIKGDGINLGLSINGESIHLNWMIGLRQYKEVKFNDAFYDTDSFSITNLISLSLSI